MEIALDLALITMIHVYIQKYMQKILSRSKKIKPTVPDTRFSSVSSVTQLCPTLYNPMNRSTADLPVHHKLLESIQTHVR